VAGAGSSLQRAPLAGAPPASASRSSREATFIPSPCPPLRSKLQAPISENEATRGSPVSLRSLARTKTKGHTVGAGPAFGAERVLGRTPESASIRWRGSRGPSGSPVGPRAVYADLTGSLGDRDETCRRRPRPFSPTPTGRREGRDDGSDSERFQVYPPEDAIYWQPLTPRL